MSILRTLLLKRQTPPSSSVKIPGNVSRFNRDSEWRKIYYKSQKLEAGIKINLSREIKGKILYLHISKSTTGKYYASFTCEVPTEQYDKTGTAVGVDVGIKEACTLASGKKYANIHALKKLEKK